MICIHIHAIFEESAMSSLSDIKD